MTTANNQLDMNANRLKTTERKIEWLKNEIKDLEYVLSDDCINRNLKLCQLQMYREHLSMLEMDLHDWNDVSNTEIPLNKEIFALLEDRMDPKKLRPAVIVAKMIQAKRLTWTESKDGDALCYDIAIGNFFNCNGAAIKYWKHVNIPSNTPKHPSEENK